MDLGIRGRSALVLAATDGLGEATARALHAEGARVIVTGRDRTKIDDLTSELGDAIGFVMDLRDAQGVRAAVDSVLRQAGPVDIVVLNGPGPAPGAARDLTADNAADALQTLFFAARTVCAAVVPGMIERGWGRIVAVGSSGMIAPIAGLAGSNLARAALRSHLKGLSTEVASAGVTVNVLVPGRIATGRTAALDRAKAERAGSSVHDVVAASTATIPAGRYGLPAEFGAVAAFLCSEQAAYITGSSVRCDGGMLSVL